ncbi:F0F1 ATP synthase subunit B' [Sulfuricurvum sp. IAE1]|jgi:F-type H+-transporting ATPase subunit b|uniref:F0F1 ATP synthase subunit B family protein n=1 Tax=Sulfuricurvum sp. IAE1 TaxID=2546102 RepID=UPI0010467754|nr:F0F1 ATP synthase subunit B' [Sulfuricurvum sp. IAE1]MDD3770093.1 F0F1 ATP synthase subunit B' [Sulfuricurvum sp.]MDX9966660.1 F0F1 ATP synthase subunit B' [Sulfuricurvum sp.]TDA69200.1 F0F1 ATP synthase subunit B' [Sulfuricurvum sp. IAE1]
MLDISPMLLGSTLIVFLVLIAVLNSLLYNPLFNYMEKRDADIKHDLEQVGSNDSEIAAFHAKAEKIMSDAKLEAAALREKVIAEAKALANSKIEAKRAELALEYTKFEEALSQERARLTESLKNEVPAFQSAVSAKLNQI